MTNDVYFTATLDAAVWGAELAAGTVRGRIYLVDWVGHSPERLQAVRDGLGGLEQQGAVEIEA